MGFFGSEGKFISHDNPYLGQFAGMGYEMGPARKYYKQMLRGAAQGDYSNLPGMGQFDNEIGKLNDAYEHQSSGMLQGPMADRVKQLSLDRQKNDINGQRFEYTGNMLNNAARSLQDMFANKNQWNAQKYGTLIGGENQRYQYQPPQQGWGSQLLNTAVGSVLGGGASNPGGFGKMFGCDARLKEKVMPFNGGLDIINQLAVKEFVYNEESDVPGKQSIGVMTQDVVNFDPAMVADLGIKDYQGIDAQRLIFTMVNAIQQLSDQVTELKQQLAMVG